MAGTIQAPVLQGGRATTAPSSVRERGREEEDREREKGKRERLKKSDTWGAACRKTHLQSGSDGERSTRLWDLSLEALISSSLRSNSELERHRGALRTAAVHHVHMRTLIASMGHAEWL
ncbi:hypothetical protein EYF80_051082 [Liparis tanakae]|uniref:Uncharacterized protein n=1 Tax=Liparis tanakae TaxID=230148 RepID=A0A4Z2FCX7_9TELE|nr:hypothetical protein EYF80_051082 [Liparis tanakae]